MTLSDTSELALPGAPRPESRRVSAAGQRSTAPRAGAPSRDALRPGATAERCDKSQTSGVAAPPRGRALPSVRANGTALARLLGALTLLLLGLAQPAAADFLGIPIERQPFIKLCPDGSVVASLGPNLRGETRDTYGAFAHDGRTGRTTFLKRDRDFNERLAANPCLRGQPDRDRR